MGTIYGDSCASNLSGMDLPFVKSISLISARLAMLLVSLAFIIFANKVILYNQDLRKKINAQGWFGTQLLLHPVIVGGSVYLANITGNEWWGLVGLPFIFNFGAEPMDMTKIPPKMRNIFQVFVYIHHAGPLLGCLSCFSIQKDATFALANGLLYAHAWSLHTLGSLDYHKVLSKQKFFWPYMLQAVVVSIYFWQSIQLGLEEPTLSTVDHFLLDQLLSMEVDGVSTSISTDVFLAIPNQVMNITMHLKKGSRSVKHLLSRLER